MIKVDNGLTAPLVNNNYLPLLSYKLNYSLSNLFPIFKNPKFLAFSNSINSPLPSGDNLLYTVPAGRRAITTQDIILKNNTVGSLTAYATNGTYRYTATVTISAGNYNPIAFYKILESGEELHVVTSGAGLLPYYGIIEFDNDSPAKTVSITSMPTTVNTLYTCPAGKIAFPLSSGFGANFIGYSVSVVLFNSTLSKATISLYQVHSGDTADTVNNKNRISSAASVNTNSVGTAQCYQFTMAEDDTIQLATSVTGNIYAYMQVMEMDAS